MTNFLKIRKSVIKNNIKIIFSLILFLSISIFLITIVNAQELANNSETAKTNCGNNIPIAGVSKYLLYAKIDNNLSISETSISSVKNGEDEYKDDNNTVKITDMDKLIVIDDEINSDCYSKTNEEIAWDKEKEYCNNHGLSVPDGRGTCNSSTKTYMPYTAVTSRTSNQYALLNSEAAYTNETTGLRMIDDRICIAVGTAYTRQIGTKIDLVMANGSIVKCILGDVKSDKDTDNSNRYHLIDGSVVEMIVDYSYFDSTSQYPEELNGKISKIVIVPDTL